MASLLLSGVPPRRLCEGGLLAAGALAVVAKVGVEAGAARHWLTLALLVAAGLACAGLLLKGPAPRWLDKWRLVLVLAGLFFLPDVYGRVIGDGPEYYALLRSPLLDGDLDFANDYQGLGVRPAVTPEGRITSRVAIGQALLWLPPFVLVHLTLSLAAFLGAHVATDGFSPAYQSALTAATYCYGLAAILLIEWLVRRRLGPAVALLTALLIWLATPVHFYLVANPFMSHGTSILLATALIAAWLAARGTDRGRAWALVGLLGGLAALVRPQDLVLLALPALDLALSARPWRVRLRLSLTLLAVPAALGLLQIGVWLRLYGLGFVGTVTEQNWVGQQSLHWQELLVSPRHGLFSWTPLFIPAVLGWLVWLRRGSDRRLAGLTLALFVLAVIANATMSDWWGSESFGQRRLLALTPLFALGLAEAIDLARRRPLILVGLLGAGLVLWNLQFSFLYNSQRLVPRQRPITLEQLAGGQIDLLAEQALAAAGHWPAWLWIPLYDNLRGVWLEADPRPLHGLIDLGSDDPELGRLVRDGWYGRVQVDGGVRFRHTRGRQAWLRIPIKGVAPFRISVRCRSELGPTPLRVALVINGTTVGEAAAGTEWESLVYSVPADLVRVGPNDLSLACSLTPRSVLGAGVRDNALGVAWVRFQRLAPPR